MLVYGDRNEISVPSCCPDLCVSYNTNNTVPPLSFSTKPLCTYSTVQYDTVRCVMYIGMSMCIVGVQYLYTLCIHTTISYRIRSALSIGFDASCYTVLYVYGTVESLSIQLYCTVLYDMHTFTTE